jgi:hypothetical protein
MACREMENNNLVSSREISLEIDEARIFTGSQLASNESNVLGLLSHCYARVVMIV